MGNIKILTTSLFIVVELTHECDYGKVVSLQNGNGGTFLGGCYSKSKLLYKLEGNGKKWKWEEMSQQLKNEHNIAEMMLIPDEMTDCH